MDGETRPKVKMMAVDTNIGVSICVSRWGTYAITRIRSLTLITIGGPEIKALFKLLHTIKDSEPPTPIFIGRPSDTRNSLVALMSRRTVIEAVRVHHIRRMHGGDLQTLTTHLNGDPILRRDE